MRRPCGPRATNGIRKFTPRCNCLFAEKADLSNPTTATVNARMSAELFTHMDFEIDDDAHLAVDLPFVLGRVLMHVLSVGCTSLFTAE